MDIEKLISEMTLEEKAGLLSGSDFWHTKSVERLGIPKIMVSDGPHGLRKQDESADHLGVNDSIEAVCFPAASATACSFDPDMMEKVGEAIGDSCQHEKLAVDLGPAVNIKRSPLCGRNFEYQSEDPLLAGKMAAAEVRGLQSRNVGASVKHFAANDQEHRRMTSDSVVDERTLREIYLRAFEIIVKESQPYTIMCSYNRLNGTQVSENHWLLTDVLRGEWGFKGLVVSDWGAVRDRAKGVHAGLDLEMPSSGGINDKKIVEAVKNGTLSEEEVNTSVRRVLTLVDHYEQTKKPETPWDMEAQHKMAADVAAESAVLLKNEIMQDPATVGDVPEPDPLFDITGHPRTGNVKFNRMILPLNKNEKVVFIGEFAEKPRYQGGGSSHIHSFRVESAIDAARADGIPFEYVQGYRADEEPTDENLLGEAVAAAMDAEVAVVFAGLPESSESEGYDRTTMAMPENQVSLINAVASVCPNVVVVLHHGSPIEMDWADDKNVRGILDMYLGGQAVGRATIDLLYGKKNPSGHLAETIPMRLEDNPSYLWYGGEGDRTEYREGVFVGYRYYDKVNRKVRYPFGYGLSYSNFSFSKMSLEGPDGTKVDISDSDTGETFIPTGKSGVDGNLSEAEKKKAEARASAPQVKLSIKDTDTLTVTVNVTNTSAREGKQAVQLYVSKPETMIIRPVRELRAFAKVDLKPFETKTVTFKLDKNAFAYWNTEIHDWYVEPGEYVIEIGDSSRDIRKSASVTVKPVKKLPRHFSADTTFGDLMRDEDARKILEPYNAMRLQAAGTAQEDASDNPDSVDNNKEMMMKMMEYMPLRQVVSFMPDPKMVAMAQQIINEVEKLK